MKSISNTIANTLWTQGIIQEEDLEICRYGLGIFISSLLEVLSIFVISFFIGNRFETMLFFVSFVPLRIYAGGYHANTRLSCYLLSLAVYAVFTAIIYILPQSLYVTVNLLITVSALVVVLIAAPIIHKNKTVNNFEKAHYRKISIFICLSETLTILLLTAIFPYSKYIVSLAIGQSVVTVSMLAAIIKGKLVADK